MAINRYTTPVRQKFIPTGVSPELMMAMMKQQEAGRAAVDKADFDILSGVLGTRAYGYGNQSEEDTNILKQKQSYYKKRLEEIHDKYSDNSRLAIAAMKDLNREYVEDLTSGDLGSIKSRYATGMESYKDAMERFGKGEITDTQRQAQIYRGAEGWRAPKVGSVAAGPGGGGSPFGTGYGGESSTSTYRIPDDVSEFDNTYGGVDTAVSNLGYNPFKDAEGNRRNRFDLVQGANQAFKQKYSPANADKWSTQLEDAMYNVYGDSEGEYMQNLLGAYDEESKVKTRRGARKAFVNSMTDYYINNKNANPDAFQFAFSGSGGKPSGKYKSEWNNLSDDYKERFNNDYSAYEFSRNIDEIAKDKRFGVDKFINNEVYGKTRNKYFEERRDLINEIAEKTGKPTKEIVANLYLDEKKNNTGADWVTNVEDPEVEKQLRSYVNIENSFIDEDGDVVDTDKFKLSGKDSTPVKFNILPARGQIEARTKDGKYYLNLPEVDMRSYELLNQAKAINQDMRNYSDSSTGMYIYGDTGEFGNNIEKVDKINEDIIRSRGKITPSGDYVIYGITNEVDENGQPHKVLREYRTRGDGNYTSRELGLQEFNRDISNAVQGNFDRIKKNNR